MGKGLLYNTVPHLLADDLASYFLSGDLSLFLCKIAMLITTSQGYYEDQISKYMVVSVIIIVAIYSQ